MDVSVSLLCVITWDYQVFLASVIYNFLSDFKVLKTAD